MYAIADELCLKENLQRADSRIMHQDDLWRSGFMVECQQYLNYLLRHKIDHGSADYYDEGGWRPLPELLMLLERHFCERIFYYEA